MGPILKHVRGYKHHDLYSGCKEIFHNTIIQTTATTKKIKTKYKNILSETRNLYQKMMNF
jgi:hypothetical protein